MTILSQKLSQLDIIISAIFLPGSHKEDDQMANDQSDVSREKKDVIPKVNKDLLMAQELRKKIGNIRISTLYNLISQLLSTPESEKSF